MGNQSPYFPSLDNIKQKEFMTSSNLLKEKPQLLENTKNKEDKIGIVNNISQIEQNDNKGNIKQNNPIIKSRSKRGNKFQNNIENIKQITKLNTEEIIEEDDSQM